MTEINTNILKEHIRYYKNESKRYKKEIGKLKAENEELKKVNRHIDHNRMQKANKLMQIEKIIMACESGYTDEFIQSLLEILLAAEPVED